MNLKPVLKFSFVAIGFVSFLTSCSRPNSDKLSGILNIPDLPATTIVESCREVARDGGQMWDCNLQTNPDDLKKLMAGHKFVDLGATLPEHVYISQPTQFKDADWIHILYNDSTKKAVIATHAP